MNEDFWLNLRNDFPILSQEFKGKKLVYLDNAATSQLPKPVIEALMDFYSTKNANIHRGVYSLSEIATEQYEKSRSKVASFIGANSPEEIVFVRGTTEGLNLLASSLGKTIFKDKKGKIMLTMLEHHSNIVPWQFLQPNAELIYADVKEDGDLDYSFLDYIDNETKIVSITGASNVTAVFPDIKRISKKAHEMGAIVIVDGAQLMPHKAVNVKELECDFLVFSGHKMLAPTGIGVLWGKKELLESLPPYMGGGDMIKEVHLHESTWNNVPYKFEAGTTNIAGPIGLSKAIEYLQKIGMKNIEEREKQLSRVAMEIFNKEKEVKLYGTTEERGAIFSFNIGKVHSHDVSTIFDSLGIAIRAGHHCAQPLMERFNVTSMARASLYFYNTESEVMMIEEGIKKVKKVFRV
jgi:cysteine desulfurase/selenocysteine lyase